MLGVLGSVEEAPMVPEEPSLAVASSEGSRVGQPGSAVSSAMEPRQRREVSLKRVIGGILQGMVGGGAG